MHSPSPSFSIFNLHIKLTFLHFHISEKGQNNSSRSETFLSGAGKSIMNIDRIVDLASSSEDEDRFYLDPSDPRAHEKTKDDDSDDMSNGQKKKHISSQKDKPLSSKALSRNENRHGNTSSSSSSLVPSLTTTIDLSLDVPKKSSKTLSKWAQKFLTTKRTIVSLDEMPIEAAQDFILTAFSQSKMERNEDDMQDDSTPPNSEDENEDETTTSTKKGMGLGRPLCHVPGSANEFQNVSSNRPRPHHNTNERKNTPYKQKVDVSGNLEMMIICPTEKENDGDDCILMTITISNAPFK